MSERRVVVFVFHFSSLSGSKQRIGSDLTCDQLGRISPRRHAMHRDEGNKERFVGSGHATKNLRPVTQGVGVFLVNDKRRIAVLHFAQIHYAIRSIDNQVNLGATVGPIRRSMVPGAVLGQDSGDSEGLLDLRHMAQTHVLEGIATPGYSWRCGAPMYPPGRSLLSGAS